MKKSLIIALAAIAAPAFAGQESMVYVAPTPEPAPAACPISWEVGAFYGFAHRDIYHSEEGASEKNIDLVGIDLAAVYTINDNLSANLRFGYGFGDEVHTNNGIREWGKYETDVHMFYLMPGIRYTHALNEDWSVYGGANLGIARMTVKDHDRRHGEGGFAPQGSHDGEVGVAYSAEVGLRYQVSETCDVFAAYRFFGTTASPESDIWGDAFQREVRKQTYSMIHAGVGFKF